MTAAPPIQGVATGTAALVGQAAQGPVEQAVLVTSLGDFERVFGGPHPGQELSFGVAQFFRNGGLRAWVVRIGARSAAAVARGLAALDAADDVGLLCLPGLSGGRTLAATAAYARSRRAFYLADPAASRAATRAAMRAIRAADRGNTALFLPRLRVPDPLQSSATTLCGPAASIAGLLARTDSERGVFAFAAGTGARLAGAVGLGSSIDDRAAESLRRDGLNPIREVPGHGIVVWGARTAGTGGQSGDEWKYIPVRRMALYLEESIYRGTEWVVFEPNDEPTWTSLRESVAAFLDEIFHLGGFAGATPAESYFVHCGPSTTTQRDIDRGAVVIEIGFAPLRPAEFVVLRICRLRG